MNHTCKIFPTPLDLAEAFSEELISRIKKAEKRKLPLTLAMSGGNTPKLLFSVLAEKYSTAVSWSRIKLFWVDERCVPPDDTESNYGMTSLIFLSKIDIPFENIFRIRGEDDPEREALRYSKVIREHTRNKNGFPVFDIMILGMGDDGHTASIFPENAGLLRSEKICDTALHPLTRQRRITITGKVINNSKEIFFLVTGEKKAEIVNEIFRKNANSRMFPAAHISSVNGKTTWLLDQEAGKYIS